MPFALVIIGLILIVTGAKDTQTALGQELKSDFTGSGNFVWWIIAIGSVGSLGYVESLKTFSRMFMGLIIIAMVLANGGFFDKFTSAIASGPISPPQSEKSGGETSQQRYEKNNAANPTPKTFIEGVGNLLNAPNIVKGWASDIGGWFSK